MPPGFMFRSWRLRKWFAVDVDVEFSATSGAFYDEADFEEFRISAGSVGTHADPFHRLGAGCIFAEAPGQESGVRRRASGKPSNKDAGFAVLHLHAAQLSRHSLHVSGRHQLGRDDFKD